MAKLSARGRQELARVQKEYMDFGPDDLVTWERKTLALMSDGKVLKKLDVRFRADDRQHSYGWKVWGKVKSGMSPEEFRQAFVKNGYQEVSNA